MTDFLPLFPLQMVVFPGESLNLHIFEPRYKQLIRECDQNLVSFGIPPFLDNKVMPIGTEIELLAIEKVYPDGKMDVKTKGIGIFKMKEYYSKAPNKLYPGADITRLELDDAFDLSLNEDILSSVKKIFELLKINKKAPRSAENFRMYDIAHYIGLNLDQEYDLLNIPTELGRQQFIYKHLEHLIPLVESMESSRQRAQMNGHFKNIIPPKLGGKSED